MRFKDVGVIIPYTDTDGEHAMIRFRFYGDVDRRRMRRMIRKQLGPLGIKPRAEVLDLYIMHRKYNIYETA